jgi:drug/metabolite transporter (DMT)-like permease
MIGALIMSGILFNFDSEPIILQTAESSLFSSIFSPLFILSTILMSFLVFMSQYFRVKSLFILPPSKVSPLHYFGIVLSILFDLVVFGYEIKWYQYIGMGLASSGLMMKLLIERNEEEAKSSKSGSGKF